MFQRKSKTPAPPAFRVVPESHAGRHGYTAFATDGHRLAWSPTLNGVVAAAQIATAA